ncbi:cryptic protein-like [Hypanus sabinus]|uniref:cryptic protein-like n=1 Tax=Hypanus sabinus TaxID=79690 RepID=UPI0028C4C0BF|nr:cryptic protein-like [Hypanus sabinus]
MSDGVSSCCVAEPAPFIQFSIHKGVSIVDNDHSRQLLPRREMRLLLFLPHFLAAGSENGCGGDGACDQRVSKSNIEKPPGQSPDSLTDFKQLNIKRRGSNSSVAANVIRFLGLTDSKTLNRSCCNNGGTCILGSFCACPPPFIGRYCELDESRKSCGRFVDGQWVLKHCTWCICSYGNLHCLEVFGKVENCDADEDGHLDESYDMLTADASRLPLIQYLLSVFCSFVILGL